MDDTAAAGTRMDAARWARVSPLLDSLLDMGDAERAARLRQLQQQDPALAAELQQMLARMDSLAAQAFLEQPAVAPPTSLAGQAVGPYTLEREIGQGGMGTVWLAHRTDGRYEGQVAIKFLQTGLFGGGDAGRFAREGSILARLDHPHIARLLDAGHLPGARGDGGQPYLVLEYIAGLPIDRFCDEAGLDTTARVRLFIDVLDAVSHAHNRLILHRDLKPSNILVTADGQVKLLDFGIAKLLTQHDQPGQATELTRQAGHAFTPQFAAPEQLQGGEVTTATDVYALGVLLYLLLGGSHPTEGATGAPLDRLRAVVEQEPRRLSDTVLRQGGAGAARRARGLRGDLDTIVARALKKAPAERYPNAAELADDLRRCLANEPIAARPDSSTYRVAKFVQRHRLGVATGGLAVLALVIGVAVALIEAHEARRQQVQAEGLIEFMLTDLRKRLQPVGRLDALDAVGGKALAYYATQEADRLDADSLARRAQALHLIGEIAEQRGQLAEAAHSFQQAADSTGELLSRHPDTPQRVFDHAQSAYWLGFVARRRGQVPQAEAAFRQYLALAEQLNRLQPGQLDWQAEEAFAWGNLGVLYQDAGRSDEALQALANARRVWAGLVGPRPAWWMEMANTEGWISVCHESRGRFDQALAAEQAKTEALGRVPDAATNREVQALLATSHLVSGRIQLAMGQPEPALQALAEGQRLTRRLVALDPSNLDWTSTLVHNLVEQADLRQQQDRPQEVAPLLAEADTHLARLLAQDSGVSRWEVHLQGRLLAAQARLDPVAAAPRLARYLAAVDQRLAAGARLSADELRSLSQVQLLWGDALWRQGQPEQARSQWQGVASRLQVLAGGGDLPAQAVLAQVQTRLGRVQEARRLADSLEASRYRHPLYLDLRHRLAHAAAAGEAAPGP